MFWNLIPTSKIAPKNQKVAHKGPKKVQKRQKMWPNSKQKVRAVLPKPKLIVYIGRSKKSFRTWPQPEKKPFHFSLFNSKFSNSQFSNSEFSNSECSNSDIQIPNFQIPNFQIANFQSPKFQISISNFKLKVDFLGQCLKLRVEVWNWG